MLVIIVPQLTLYGEAEFSFLFGARSKRTAFFPIKVGTSLVTSVVAAGFVGEPLAIVLLLQRTLKIANRSSSNPPQPHWFPFNVSSLL
jgi:hypothetical protein